MEGLTTISTDRVFIQVFTEVQDCGLGAELGDAGAIDPPMVQAVTGEAMGWRTGHAGAAHGAGRPGAAPIL